MRGVAPLVLLAATIAACSQSASAPTGPVNAQVVLAPGETTNISSAAIGLRFVGVMGDSRCPAGVLCIQGGDAVVRIDVLPATGAPAAYELHTGNLQPVHHDSLTIALVDLSPYPFVSHPIAPGDYRATLKVTR